MHVVFGCGGDRDRGKRPLMGEIAARLADRASSSPPTTRAPRTPRRSSTRSSPGIGDRTSSTTSTAATAIARAIADAQAGDVVVIAGKGHEQGQEFAGGHKIPFDDVTVAREILRCSRAATAPRPMKRWTRSARSPQRPARA